MITVKNGDLPEIIKSLAALMDMELAVKPAYWVAKLSRKVAVEHKSFEDVRTGLIRKYAEHDDKGEIVRTEDGKGVKVANVEGFTKEFNELCEIDVELPGDKLLLKDLPSTIKPSILLPLMDIIVEE